jgi:hypothetical protein
MIFQPESMKPDMNLKLKLKPANLDGGRGVEEEHALTVFFYVLTYKSYNKTTEYRRLWT